MNVIEYLDSKKYKYKIKGKEAVLEECPFCHHIHSKNRFLVNVETGVYICNRQNECGAKGVLKLDKTESTHQIMEINQEIADKLRKEVTTLSKTQLDYMASRGIEKATLTTARVLSRQGAFVFFYTSRDGKIVGAKYRTLDKKIWAESRSEMVLLNWDRIQTRDTLYITEGEIDMLSLMQIGMDNVVSVPNGTSNLDWIDKHFSWLEEFKKVVLLMDNDQAGKKAIKNIYDRLKGEKFEVKTLDLLFYKDPNEILVDENGIKKLMNIIANNEIEIESPNTIALSSVKADTEVVAIDSGDRGFNALTGGIRYGEVVLVTGNSGSGKSVFVNNIMANLLNQGFKVYTHQGEFRPGKFKANLYKIMCRPSHIETYMNQFKGKVYGKISTEIESKIDKWLGDKLDIHGNQLPSKSELIETMTKEYKKKGIRFFFIDNLMTIQIGASENKYDEQKLLFLELQEFAKKYKVFVCIVAHPKKNNANMEDVDQYVISGSSDMVNLANSAFYLKRLNQEEVDKFKQETGYNASVGIVSLKDREFGDVGLKAYWNYEIKTGRFLDFKSQDRCKNKKYNWEDYKQGKSIEMDFDDLPF